MQRGGTARVAFGYSSDLDLLVDWESDRSLLDVVGLKRDLEDLLGVTVDIGSERGLHWFIRGEVLREAAMSMGGRLHPCWPGRVPWQCRLPRCDDAEPRDRR